MSQESTVSPNPFRLILDRVREASSADKEAVATQAVGETIPFMATVGAEVVVYTPEKVQVALPDRPAVHNHVGTPHAAALALLAESATGLVMAMNLPDGAVPLLRNMNVDFRRMATGRVTARAVLPEAEQERIAARPIGKVDVNVELTADDGREAEDGPAEAAVTGTMQWAWLPEAKVRR
jgi:acyl-coenzyme A thioesterase PaaI-like protein